MKVVSHERNNPDPLGFPLFTIMVRAKDIPYAKLEQLWVDHGFPENRMSFNGMVGIHKSGFGFDEPVLYRFIVRYIEWRRFVRQFLPALKKLEAALSFEEINAPKGDDFIAALQPWM